MSASTTNAGRPLRLAKIVLSVIVLGVIIAVAALARTSGAQRVAASVGISTARQPYSTLAFVHPAELGVHGVTYSGRQVHDQVRFAVSNRRHHRQRYRWTISFAPGGRSYHGTLELSAGGSATVGRRVLLPCARLTRTRHSPRVQVRVRLALSDEAIDYWQVCGG